MNINCKICWNDWKNEVKNEEKIKNKFWKLNAERLNWWKILKKLNIIKADKKLIKKLTWNINNVYNNEKK